MSIRPPPLRNHPLLLPLLLLPRAEEASRGIRPQFRPYAQPSSTSPTSTTPSSPSVAPSEITHFNALASTWWDPHGSSRLLHLMNPLRHSFIHTCRHASQPSPRHNPGTKLRYLDIGCGGGIFAESAARLPNTESVRAIDPSPAVLEIAKAHAKKDPALREKLTYLNTTLESLPLPTSITDQVDILSLFEVIEHVNHPTQFLDTCLPFLKPGGWIIISTIARTWTSWLTTKVVAEDVLGIVPKGTHDWEKYLNEDELRGYFAGRRDWGNARCMGVVYVPGVGWKEVGGSEKFGNYFFGAQKLEG